MEEGGHTGAGRSGLVDESVEISAKEFKRQMASKEEKKGQGEKAQGSRREYEEDSDGGQRKKSRTGEVSSTAASSSLSPPSASTSSLSATDRISPVGDDDDYDLSDEGVRQYITNAGGRVKIADLKEVNLNFMIANSVSDTLLLLFLFLWLFLSLLFLLSFFL